jgi:hypothetical protein
MKNSYLRITLAGLIASSLAACSSQASLSTSQPQSAATPSAVGAQNKEEPISSIIQTVTRLREVKTGSGDPRVPPEAKQLLTVLKHQLRDVIHDTLNANSQQDNPRRLQAAILTVLQRGGIKVEEPGEIVVDENYTEPDYVQEYGNIYRIVIERPSGHGNLLIATTTLSIPCGTDTSLYIFRNRDGRWELILAQESNGYDEVSGAQGAFGYAISPPDAQNNFFVVTANINPWCTSNWQSIRYAVLREGRSAYEPRVILNQKHTIFRDHDPPFSIRVTTNSFTLSFDGGEAMERMNNGEDVTEEEARRSHVERYRIEGDQAKRIS